MFIKFFNSDATTERTKMIPLCCSKANTSDAPPECAEAAELGLEVLSIQDNKDQNINNDNKTE